MIRLIMRTCQQCGFEQSEYIHKTVDVNLPEVEKLMECPGDGFAVVGAHLIASQNTAESAATDSQQPQPAIADTIVAALEADISNRRGLKWEWEKIDADVKDEIRAAWKNILLRAGVR